MIENNGKDFKKIKLTEENGVCTITIANPPANALHVEARREIMAVLNVIEHDTAIHEVVIRGSGDYFSAGGNIKTELYPLARDRQFLAGYKFSKEAQRLMRYIKNFPKPVIAEVDGYAFGGGFELALACHKIIASTRSIFGMTQITLGILPGWGGTIHLPQKCARTSALWLICEGQPINAKEALSRGIVQAPLFETQKDPIKTPLPKRPAPLLQKALEQYFLEDTSGYTEDQLFEREAYFFYMASFQNDALEGITAFIEERDARFEEVPSDDRLM